MLFSGMLRVIERCWALLGDDLGAAGLVEQLLQRLEEHVIQARVADVHHDI